MYRCVLQLSSALYIHTKCINSFYILFVLETPCLTAAIPVWLRGIVIRSEVVQTCESCLYEQTCTASLGCLDWATLAGALARAGYLTVNRESQHSSAVFSVYAVGCEECFA